MQQIPFPGHSFEVLAMDYNMMFNQSRTPNGDPSMRSTWGNQAREAFLAGFRRAYRSNRAPLIIGNHFERWNGGIYMDAIAEAGAQMAAPRRAVCVLPSAGRLARGAGPGRAALPPVAARRAEADGRLGRLPECGVT
jgi:hypothetical protein